MWITNGDRGAATGEQLLKYGQSLGRPQFAGRRSPLAARADEHRATFEVYWSMRLLCVARHAFLSDHLCRYFGALDVQCETAVGVEGARAAARSFEPHLVVAESELLGPAVLETWSHEDSLHDVPVLAVSLTRRPEECLPADLCGVAGVIYLPTLEHSAARALLDGARKPRGVGVPADASIVARLTTPTH